MPTDYPVTHCIFFISNTGGTGTLSWNSTSPFSQNTVITDVNEDGNWDIGTDLWGSLGDAFSGFMWEAPNGTVYPIFVYGGNNYYLPYNIADYDVGANFPSSGSTALFSDNAIAFPLCFLAGSMIATPKGECLVEELAIGDLVQTADGRDVAVKWLGRQTQTAPAVNLRLPMRAQPVRIRAGALGDGLPNSDLTVTADHGMVIDGLVINASALVNGTTIDWVPLAELGNSLTVYHIETEAHDVILANGAPSETFIDVAGRAAFDNFAEYLSLYGTERIIPEMKYHRITTQRLLPNALKMRLDIPHADPVDLLQLAG